MRDAFLVRCHQSLGHLDADVDNLFDACFLLFDFFRKRLAVDVLRASAAQGESAPNFPVK
ncbi:hypothetical protein L0337_43335 [candidate division KSB1 bacterium]|nr:hypothetical protein [candidate division KSB1 bacterium]